MDMLRSVSKQYTGNLWSQSRKCCDAVQIFFCDLVDLCRVLAEFHGGGCHTGAQPRGVIQKFH